MAHSIAKAPTRGKHLEARSPQHRIGLEEFIHVLNPERNRIIGKIAANPHAIIRHAEVPAALQPIIGFRRNVRVHQPLSRGNMPRPFPIQNLPGDIPGIAFPLMLADQDHVIGGRHRKPTHCILFPWVRVNDKHNGPFLRNLERLDDVAEDCDIGAPAGETLRTPAGAFLLAFEAPGRGVIRKEGIHDPAEMEELPIEPRLFLLLGQGAGNEFKVDVRERLVAFRPEDERVNGRVFARAVEPPLIDLIVEPGDIGSLPSRFIWRSKRSNNRTLGIKGSHSVFTIDVGRWQFIVDNTVKTCTAKCRQILIVAKKLD